MRSSFHRSSFAARTFVLLTVLLASLTGSAQLSAKPQITQPIDNEATVLLKGNTHPLANAQNDRGRINDSQMMERVVLTLKRSPEQTQAMAAAIAAMHQPGSPTFHKWLSADEVGKQYGPSQADLDKVTQWLGEQGLTVTGISKSHTAIEFTGSAHSVANAFHTELHQYSVMGKTYTANASDPQIPRALTPVVQGPVALNNFPLKKNLSAVQLIKYDRTKKKWLVKNSNISQPASSGTNATPQITVEDGNGDYILPVGPADFAKIYNVQPLWDQGIDGTGQHIAILAESNITATDVDKFRAAFGLPANPVNIILNGADPGLVTDDVTEATLDAEWSGAVAKNATIDFIVSGSTDTTDGIILSAFYAIDNQIAPVTSLSYGACEVSLGTDGNFFFYQLWQQAAAEGITPIVAAGDSGADTCDQGNSVSFTGDSVSGFASTPYNIAVGGTDFKVGATDPVDYWSQTNDPVTLQSALSYIPEVPWNGSCAGPDLDSLLASGYRTSDAETLCNLPILQGSYLQLNGGGGGVSNCTQTDPNNPNSCIAGWPQPDWQKGIFGVPNNTARYVPDISLFGSNGVFNSLYVFCYSDLAGLTTNGVCDFTDPNDVQLLGAGGTSFGAPAFAGIMALVNQKTNASQGVANYVLYDLAKAQYGTTTAPVKNSCDASLGAKTGNSCTFHDISTGSNAQPCESGTPGCITKSLDDAVGILAGFDSSPGFDPVTGLGSVNAYNLVMNWAAVSKSPTTTTLTVAPVTSTYGLPIALSGAVASTGGTGTPTGTVTLLGMQGAAQTSFDLTAGAYAGTTALFPAGNYSLSATYMGDGAFQQSTSSPTTVSISRAASSGSLSFESQDPRSHIVLSTGNQVPYGSAIIPIYTVQGLTVSGIQAPTGNVSFSQGSNSLGDIALQGTQASVQLIAGLLGQGQVSASYDGDSNYLQSPQITGSFTVVQGTVSLSAHASSDYVTGSGTVTLTALLGSHSYAAPPMGTVNFYVNGVLAGAAPVTIGQDVQTQAWADTASFPLNNSLLKEGSNFVTASYSGDTNYAAVASSTPAPLLYSLTTITPTITLNADQTAITSAAPVTLTASVLLNGTPATVGLVTFKDGATILATVPVVGSTPAAGAKTGVAKLVITLPSGNHSITAVYAGVRGAVASVTSSATTVAVTGSQTTTTRIAASSNATTPANYDFQIQLLSGGLTPPTGTLTLNENSFSGSLGQIAIDPSMAKIGTLIENTLQVTGTTQLMATADFNGDGIPDVAVVRAQSLDEAENLLTNLPQLYIFLGKGDGTFQAPLTSTISADPNLGLPYTIAAGDFNADGNVDIAFGFQFGGTITTLLGKGDGTFQIGPSISVPGALPAFNNMVVSDFNHDGILDIAASEAASGDIGDTGGLLILLGNGDGSFQLQPRIDRPGTRFIRTADVNRDGNDDLIYTLPYGPTSFVGVMLGNGDGTFQAESTYQTGAGPWELGAGDLNGDGYPDIVTPNKDDNTVSVLLNHGDGTFTSTSYPVGQFPVGAAIGDINHDGNADVIVSNNTDNTLTVYYGNGDGTLSSGPLLSTGLNPAEVIVTDLNHDGTPDILVAENQAGTAGVFLNGTTISGILTNIAVIGATTQQETVTGSYSGDSTYTASTSQPLTLAGSGGRQATHAVWTPPVLTNVFGVAVSSGLFNAQEANHTAGSFSYVAQMAGGQNISLQAGTVLPTAGDYTLTATFTPTDAADYAPSVATSSYTVTKAGVTQALTVAAAQLAQNATASFTDVVVSTTTGVPTGTVTFFAGTSTIGVAALDSNGTATVTTNLLPLGTSSITAMYSGDTNFNSTTSLPSSVSVGSSSFNLTLAGSQLTITAGGSGTMGVSAMPQFGFAGSVTLSCGNLFPGATCSFSPASGALGNGGLQSTLTVSTPAIVKAELEPSMWFAVGGGTSLACVLMLLFPRRSRRSVWLGVLLAAATTSLMLGCAGGGIAQPNQKPSTLSLSSSSAKAASGSSFTLNAAVEGANASSAVGTVSFYEGTNLLGQPVNAQSGKASLPVSNLSVGIHNLTAIYSGDDNNAGATSAVLQQVITGNTTLQVIGTSNGLTQSAPLSITIQ